MASDEVSEALAAAAEYLPAIDRPRSVARTIRMLIELLAAAPADGAAGERDVAADLGGKIGCALQDYAEHSMTTRQAASLLRAALPYVESAARAEGAAEPEVDVEHVQWQDEMEARSAAQPGDGDLVKALRTIADGMTGDFPGAPDIMAYGVEQKHEFRGAMWSWSQQVARAALASSGKP